MAPNLILCHATRKGNGSAMKVALEPPRVVADSVNGSRFLIGGKVYFSLATQSTVGEGVSSFPTFDWDNAVYYALDWREVAMVIQVFRGECESLFDDMGITNVTAGSDNRLMLKHVTDLYAYSLEISNITRKDGITRTVSATLSDAEALGLCKALSAVMKTLVFGKDAL